MRWQADRSSSPTVGEVSRSSVFRDNESSRGRCVGVNAAATGAFGPGIRMSAAQMRSSFGKRPSPRKRRPPAGGREHIVGRREATSGFTTVQPPVLRRRPGSHRQRSRARPHLQSHVRPAGRITPRRPLPCKQPQTSGTSIHPGLKFPALPSAAPASGVGSASSEAWAQPRCVVESRSTEDTVL